MSKKMSATNKGFNGHPILHLFLLSNLLELLSDVLDPSCIALAATFSASHDRV